MPVGAPSQNPSASGGADDSDVHALRKVVLVAHLTKPPIAFDAEAARRILGNEIAGVILRSGRTRQVQRNRPGHQQQSCDLAPRSSNAGG